LESAIFLRFLLSANNINAHISYIPRPSIKRIILHFYANRGGRYLKIYLINPKFPITYWGFEHSNDLSGAKYTTPPLALATIAGLTPVGIDVEICDENIEGIDFDHDCDIVGLTSYLVQGPRAFEIAAKFRNRGTTVVVGGPLTTLSPETCKDKADVLFTGEAEYTWPQFLADYPTGTYRSEYIQKEKINLHDSPVPRMDLLKLGQYTHAAIQTTRGCPFGCEFCDIIVLFGRKVRCKKVSQIIFEMQAALKQRVGSIFFTDDNFIGNRKFIKELLRAIIEFNKTTDVSMQYMTQVSIDLAKDDELLQLMYEAHFNRVFIGIETPRKASLKEANKGQNVRSDLVLDIRKIQSYNIDVSAGMIVGFDHDDASIFQEQFEFIMKSNISWAMTSMLQAIPKTPLYERLKLENRLDTSREAATNTTLEVNIFPKNMTREELVTGYHWLCKQLYSYENYAKRVIGNFKEYTKKPMVKVYFPTFFQLKILLKTFRYYLLTWHWRRFHFSMKILKYVLMHKPFLLYDAMVHLVSFKHLHTYVYDYLEKAFNEKVAAFEQSVIQSKQGMASAYEEMRKHAAVVSQKAVKAYDEMKSQIAMVGEYAAKEYEELCHRAAALNQQAAHAYDELRKQAQDLSQHAVHEYNTLLQHAASAVSKRMLKVEFEEFRRQLIVFNSSIAMACEELRKQALALNEQVAAAAI
jgi:radical SAM superfamily enzyme YgiQ (UPF0313 family)